MNNLYRAIVSLATVFPLSITFTYLYADWIAERLPFELAAILQNDNFLKISLVFAVIVLNLCFGIGTVKFLKYLSRKIDVAPVKVNSNKELGADSILSYLPYVLPLFMGSGERLDLGGWILGLLLLISLSWISMTIAFSPLLRICGLRFFEVEFADGETATLLVDSLCLRPKSVDRAAKISDSCFYGVV